MVDPFESYRALPKKDWHDYEAMKRDKKRQGPGEGGEQLLPNLDFADSARQVLFFSAVIR